MEKILKLNVNPRLRSYTHHGFIHSIMTTDNRVIEDFEIPATQISVKDFEKYKWDEYFENISYKNKNDDLDFFVSKFNIKMNSLFTRSVNKNDEIEIVINKQLESHGYSTIKIFLVNEEGKKDDFIQSVIKDNYGYGLVNFPRDGSCYLENKTCSFVEQVPEFPVTLKIKKENKHLTFEVKDAKHDLKKIEKECMLKDDESLKIGFGVDLGDNKYYSWLFSNYVNLYFNSKLNLQLDFMVDQHKNWGVHTSNFFIDYNTETDNSILATNMSILDYVKNQINLNRYVEMEINDNFHKDLTDAQGKLFHPDLVYGYSDEKQELYIMWYSFGVPKLATLKYSDFLSERNIKPHRFVYSLRYNPNAQEFSFSLRYVLQQFEEALNGKNISFWEFQYDDNNTVYGKDIPNEMKKKENLHFVVDDIRIGHIFYEYAILNADRFEYLWIKNLISKEEFEKINEILKQLSETAINIRNMSLKASCGRIPSEEKIISYLDSLDKNYSNFLETAVDILKSKCN